MMRFWPLRMCRIRCRRAFFKLGFLCLCVLFTWWTIGRMYSLISVQEFYERSYIPSEKKGKIVETVSAFSFHKHSVSNASPHNSISSSTTSVLTSMKTTQLPPSIRNADNNVVHLRQSAKGINDKNIDNLNNLHSNFKDQGIVIIVQVHDRAQYFQELVNSLRVAENIQNSLLIISLDFFSDEVLDIVKSIDFCQVRHIFFPHSMQLYPDQFPGTDPNDCPRDIRKDEARKVMCNNAEHPDKYGHYREAKFTMTKHHWWWKVNVVFDKMVETRDYNGPVLFLEDDHYVSPDFISTLKMMNNLRQNDPECQNNRCDIMTLGSYSSVTDFSKFGGDVVMKTVWQSNQHNMGMAMTRQTWQKIKQKSMFFCNYDDYNWDWTLMYLSLKILPSPMSALVMKTPRVFHLGECGLHHKKKMCNVQEVLVKYKKIIHDNMIHLFKTSLRIVTDKSSKGRISQANGGWGDNRDHLLCQSFVNKT